MSKINKLTEKAKEHLDPNENIRAVVLGKYETERLGQKSVRNGVFLATDVKLVFFANKFIGYDFEVFPYSNISSIEFGKNLMGHRISFFSSGNNVKMKWIQKQDDNVKKLVNFIQDKISKN